MNTFAVVAGVVACCTGGIASFTFAASWQDRRRRKALREAALGASATGTSLIAPPSGSRGLALRYAEALNRRLFIGSASPITPCVREKRAGQTRQGARYLEKAPAAGCAKDVSVSSFCEARTRLAIVGALAGALIGVVFSTELAVLLGVVGALFGRSMLMRDVEAVRRRRAVEAQRYLSEMLDVVALGLRSGLTFDRSFELYGSHFASEFAQSCAKASRRWMLGLTTREEALRELAASYDCRDLSRVVDGIVRGLRFGTALAELLEEAASQSRATYRTALEERVAKAPVKMMLPTGTLILPAMLLLVLGPILLELVNGF